MKTHWVTLLAVLIGGLGIGAALAGRPTTPANDVRITSVPSTTSPASTTVAPAPTTATTTTATTTSSTTTVAAVPTTTTTPATTTVASTTTVAATSTTTLGSNRNVSVLVVNAANVSGIARAEAVRLATLGYPRPLTDDAVERLQQTTVYARVGYEDAARLLLADVGMPADRLLPFPARNVSTLDDRANLILALGLDWPA
jgi:LytR cell envelope-related transcriptional attenuator